MKNQTENKIDNEMEAGVMQGSERDVRVKLL